MTSAEYGVVADEFGVCATKWQEMDKSAPPERAEVKHEDVIRIMDYSDRSRVRAMNKSEIYEGALANAIHSCDIAIRLAKRLPDTCHSAHVKKPLEDLIHETIRACGEVFNIPNSAYDTMAVFATDAYDFDRVDDAGLKAELTKFKDVVPQWAKKAEQRRTLQSVLLGKLYMLWYTHPETIAMTKQIADVYSFGRGDPY
ncbi:hypothetical protein CERSUDRAFT_100260 [Gelatoporia subvermispora B]|uniref:Uncharacterized protein n=1 Tax=Ceriporiopsis subvermispora (strain B) TaxID=914234 RepID=M2QYH9_CERS8|nr:hypothetical protein CERSUDRAFT_100260 [Gelatoporia subvermispora B]